MFSKNSKGCSKLYISQDFFAGYNIHEVGLFVKVYDIGGNIALKYLVSNYNKLFKQMPLVTVNKITYMIMFSNECLGMKALADGDMTQTHVVYDIANNKKAGEQTSKKVILKIKLAG